MARSKAKNKSSALRSWLQDNAILEYLRDTRAELRKVHWPSREESENLTKIVLGVTVAMSILMGVLDYLFALELRGLIQGNAIAIAVGVVTVVASLVVAVIVSRQTAR